MFFKIKDKRRKKKVKSQDKNQRFKDLFFIKSAL